MKRNLPLAGWRADGGSEKEGALREERAEGGNLFGLRSPNKNVKLHPAACLFVPPSSPEEDVDVGLKVDRGVLLLLLQPCCSDRQQPLLPSLIVHRAPTSCSLSFLAL